MLDWGSGEGPGDDGEGTGVLVRYLGVMVKDLGYAGTGAEWAAAEHGEFRRGCWGYRLWTFSGPSRGSKYVVS